MQYSVDLFGDTLQVAKENETNQPDDVLSEPSGAGSGAKKQRAARVEK